MVWQHLVFNVMSTDDYAGLSPRQPPQHNVTGFPSSGEAQGRRSSASPHSSPMSEKMNEITLGPVKASNTVGTLKKIKTSHGSVTLFEFSDSD